MLVHKGCMFFGVFWILIFTSCECIVAIVQLAVYNRVLSNHEISICYSVTNTVQLALLLLAINKYRPELFLQKFVRYNLIGFAAHTCLLWLAVIFYILA